MALQHWCKFRDRPCARGGWRIHRTLTSPLKRGRRRNLILNLQLFVSLLLSECRYCYTSTMLVSLLPRFHLLTACSNTPNHIFAKSKTNCCDISLRTLTSLLMVD